MINSIDFQRYLAGEAENSHPAYGFVLPSSPAADAAPYADEMRRKKKHEEMAKTFLKKTLTEHDKVYHPNGYKEGDDCNFRASMIKNDIADDILAEKPKEEVKIGLVEFKEDKDGNKKIVDVVEAKEAVAETVKADGDLSDNI